MRQVGTGVGKGGVYYFGRLSAASPSSTGVNSRLWSVGGYMGGMGVSRKGSDPPITSATNKGAGRPDGNWWWLSCWLGGRNSYRRRGASLHPAPNYHAWHRSSVCSVMPRIVMPDGGRWNSPLSWGHHLHRKALLNRQYSPTWESPIYSTSSIVTFAKMGNILQQWLASYWRSRI